MSDEIPSRIRPGTAALAVLTLPVLAGIAFLSTYVRVGALTPGLTTENATCLAATCFVVARGKGLPLGLPVSLAVAGLVAGILVRPLATDDFRWWLLPFAAAFLAGGIAALLPKVGLLATFAAVPLLGSGVGVGLPVADARTVGALATTFAPGAIALGVAATAGWLLSHVSIRPVPVLFRVFAAWTAAGSLMAGVMLWRSLSALSAGNIL